MTLTSVYERFLKSPNPLNLTNDASLHYVTSLTSFSQPGPIIRHLEGLGNEIKVKSKKVISAVEGTSSIAVEVEIVLEFVDGGGAYLPEMDSTFLQDQNVTIPVTHIVQFNGEQKITQIRCTWDQASLLKQVGVIGERGRRWPIFDGKDQIKIITSNSTTAEAAAPAKVTPPNSPRGRHATENGFSARQSSPSKKFIKDPHTSLDTFFHQRVDENIPTAAPNPVAPRSSAKPADREMSDLFAAGHEDYESKPDGSPRKVVAHDAVAPKGAGSQKFQPSRLFDDDQEPVKEAKIYKTNPARYNHFDLGDEIEDDTFQHRPERKTEKASIPMRAKTGRHGSQWDFEDFVTPAKPGTKVRGQDVVHFSLNNEDSVSQGEKPATTHHARRDAEKHFDIEDDGAVIDRQVKAKPRKDAQTHFEFGDQPTPPTQRIIGRTKAAQGLYRNVLEEDGDEFEHTKPLNPISNNAGRKTEFDTHWSMNGSPVGVVNDENKGKDVSKNAKQMTSHWDAYENSPEPTRKPATRQNKKGLQSSWDFGD